MLQENGFDVDSSEGEPEGPEIVTVSPSAGAAARCGPESILIFELTSRSLGKRVQWWREELFTVDEGKRPE